jgi:hypothetical protein
MNTPGTEIIEVDQARSAAARELLIGFADKVLRYTLGLVLLGAVGLKVLLLIRAPDPNAVRLSEARLSLGTELGVALWLLSGVAEVWSRRAVMLLLIVFMVAAAKRLLEGHSDCGCFGAVRVPPAITLAFDLTSVVALISLERSKGRRVPERRARFETLGWMSLAVAMSVLLVVIVLPAVRFAPTFGAPKSVVVLDPSSWAGKPFPMLKYIQGESGDDLAKGKFTVILFNHTCAPCRQYLTRISRGTPAVEATTIRLMDLAPAAPVAQELASLSPLREAPLKPGFLFSVDVPLEVSLDEGVVTCVRHPE